MHGPLSSRVDFKSNLGTKKIDKLSDIINVHTIYLERGTLAPRHSTLPTNKSNGEDGMQVSLFIPIAVERYLLQAVPNRPTA